MSSFIMPSARPSFAAALPSTAFHVALLIGAIWGTRAGTVALRDHTVEIPIDWAAQPTHHANSTTTMTATLPGAPIVDGPIIPDIPRTDLPPLHPGVPIVDHWDHVPGYGMPLASPGADTLLGAKVFPESEVDDLPALLSSGRLRYPAVLAEAGIDGAVTLTFVIDAEGKVDPAAIEIVSATHPGFVAAAEEAVGTSLFRPARKHGAAVRVRVRQTITFKH